MITLDSGSLHTRWWSVWHEALLFGCRRHQLILVIFLVALPLDPAMLNVLYTVLPLYYPAMHFVPLLTIALCTLLLCFLLCYWAAILTTVLSDTWLMGFLSADLVTWRQCSIHPSTMSCLGQHICLITADCLLTLSVMHHHQSITDK